MGYMLTSLHVLADLASCHKPNKIPPITIEE